MSALLVVDDVDDWPTVADGFSIVPARSYLAEHAYGEERATRVFNLCSAFRYQSLGYYVSLLAEARGHRPWPRAGTTGDAWSQDLASVRNDAFDELVEHTLAPLKAEHFDLSVYFGRTLAQRYSVLARQLFDMLQMPLLRAHFQRVRGHWRLNGVKPFGMRELPEAHRHIAVEAAANYFAGHRSRGMGKQWQFALAILNTAESAHPASNAAALEKFRAAAVALGMRSEIISGADVDRLGEFDALFIRDTTYVNHYTYHFSRRAQSEGLVVIDDPESILKCNNKVYLAELLARHQLPVPRTLLIHRGNIDTIIPSLALPCVLKQPDSSFSVGVTKVDNEPDLRAAVPRLLDKSELIVAQEWLPTEFDWRVGVLDRRVIFVCKYYMASGHWQIINHDAESGRIEGHTEALPISEAPEEVVRIGLEAANLIGDGFYGVDIKQIGARYYIIEINDNPSVDTGHEDAIMKDALYREVMAVFLRRLRVRAEAGGTQ